MLYFVPTPIGNLEDITMRSLRLFNEARTIICEDPREIRKLMNLLEISNEPTLIPFLAFHTVNEKAIKQALSVSQKPDACVLFVSDAGMPGISDPGYDVIKMAQEMGIEYTVLPGANALLLTAVASGLVGKEFTFLGFLPIKKGRQKSWNAIATSSYPVILYESVHRIDKFITEAKLHLQPTQKIFIGRELTKKFEQYLSLTVAELSVEHFTHKGEFVIVIGNG